VSLFRCGSARNSYSISEQLGQLEGTRQFLEMISKRQSTFFPEKVVGHKDIGRTMRYSHLAPDHMKNAVRILDSSNLDTGENKLGIPVDRPLTKVAEGV